MGGGGGQGPLLNAGEASDSCLGLPALFVFATTYVFNLPNISF